MASSALLSPVAAEVASAEAIEPDTGIDLEAD